MRRSRAGAALLAAAGLGLVACSGDAGPSGPPRVGDPLPALTFASLAGESVSLDAFDDGPVLINLWATWCPPCRAEIPFLQTLHEEFGPRGLRVVGISEDNAGALDQVEEFLAEAGVTYDNLLDPRSEAMDAFRLLGLPATYLVDAEGRIVLVRTGPVSERDKGFMDALESVVTAGTEESGR